MKTIYQSLRIIIIAGLLLLIQACSEDFLNTEPSFAIDEDEIFNSIITAESALVGTYDLFSAYSGEGLWGPIMSDLVGEDLMINSVENYGWFVPVYQLNTLANYTYNNNPWWVGYTVIYNANRIITNADQIPDASVEEIKNLQGQGKVIRAYTMLKLVQMYAQAYNREPLSEGIMIVTKAVNAGSDDIGRSSVEEVYTQIESDLISAIDLLEENTDKGFFDKRAAQAILARTYLDMNNWEKARDMAVLAAEGMELMSIDEMYSGFLYRNSESIFTIAYTQEDNNVYMSIPSFYWPEFGYSSIRANDLFVSMFNTTDSRKGLFTLYEAIDSDRNLVLKFAHNGQVGNAERIAIRASEMILIQAECEAELENFSEAQSALYQIQVRSEPGVAKSTNTGEDLIEEILLERRKELFGEGFRWNDIKRRNLPFIREGDHWVKFDFGTEDEDYYRLTFPIPQSEIDVNKMINEENQNPGY
jgi:hypothetical protein